jgi:hypothetical protein
MRTDSWTIRAAGILLLVLVVVSPHVAVAQGAECDRECLIGLVDQYLEALVAHDPSGLPLAETVKFTGVPGVESLSKAFGPMNLQAGEIFKIYGGQIHEIDANGLMIPYGSDSNWDQ